VKGKGVGELGGHSMRIKKKRASGFLSAMSRFHGQEIEGIQTSTFFRIKSRGKDAWGETCTKLK